VAQRETYRTAKDVGEDADWGTIVSGLVVALSPFFFIALGLAFPERSELDKLRFGLINSVLFFVYGCSVTVSGWLESSSDYFKWLDNPVALLGIGLLGLNTAKEVTEIQVANFTTILAAATVFLAFTTAAAKYLTRGGRI
jgi:hypothetical protein